MYDKRLLQRRRPAPELLIPETNGFAAERTNKPVFHFHVEQYDYCDTCAELEQAVHRMFRGIEALFL